MDIDKKIAEWEEVVTSESVIELSLALNECIDQLKECRGKEVLTGKVRNAAWNGHPLDGSDAQALEGALSQVERELKERREELRTALDTANRSSKAVLKWNAEIEQRTKDAVRDSILENCEPKTEYGPHGQHREWYTADDIDQAIDSVGKK